MDHPAISYVDCHMGDIAELPVRLVGIEDQVPRFQHILRYFKPVFYDILPLCRCYRWQINPELCITSLYQGTAVIIPLFVSVFLAIPASDFCECKICHITAHSKRWDFTAKVLAHDFP